MTALNQPVAITLTVDQWDTIRLGLLLHSMDARERPDSQLYADLIREAFQAINEVVPAGPRTTEPVTV